MQALLGVIGNIQTWVSGAIDGMIGQIGSAIDTDGGLAMLRGIGNFVANRIIPQARAIIMQRYQAQQQAAAAAAAPSPVNPAAPPGAPVNPAQAPIFTTASGGVLSYDRGGTLPPGLSLAYNGTGQVENVAPGGLVSAGGGGGGGSAELAKAVAGAMGPRVKIDIHPSPAHDEATIADMVNRRLGWAAGL
jgi:hypothetical protein